MNTIVTPGTFGSQRIMRLTDQNTKTNYADVWLTADDGLPTLWNTDDTAVAIKRNGGQRYIMHFTPATMQTAGMSAVSLPATGMTYSRQTNNVIYALGNAFTATCTNTTSCAQSGTSGVALLKISVTPNATPANDVATYTNIKDLGTDANCFGAAYNASWTSVILAPASSDTVFTVAASTGAQGTGTLTVSYNTSTGQCSTVDSSTGNVTVNGVSQGTMTTTDRFYLHESYQTQNPAYAILVTSGQSSMISGTYVAGFYIWQIGTTSVVHCGVTGSYYCDGHDIWGYLGAVRGKSLTYNSYSNPAVPQTVNLPSPPSYPDIHPSWQNNNTSDTAYFLVKAQDDTSSTFYNVLGTLPTPFWNELFMVKPDGSNTVSREVNTFDTGWSPYFDTGSAIASLSQTGKFAIFSSDWMCSLGSITGTTAAICGAQKWIKNDSSDYVLNSKMMPTSGNANNSVYQATACSGTCTTGGTAPTWPQTTSSTVTDNTITWTNIGQQNARSDDFVGEMK